MNLIRRILLHDRLARSLVRGYSSVGGNLATQSITLDGSTSFSAFGDNFTWDNGLINRVSIGFDTTTENNTLNATFSGSAWRIRHLSLYDNTSFNFNVNLTDTNDGVSRQIDRLQLPDGGGTATLTLFNSRVRYIEGGADANVTLNLGNQSTRHIGLWDAAQTTVRMGSGNVDAMFLGYGTNNVTLGVGYINLLEFSDGSVNTITDNGTGSDDTNFGAIRINEATNNFTFRAGGDLISLGRSTSTVNLLDGFYGAITSYSGTNTITVGADAEVRSIGFSGGVDIVTVRGSVEQIQLGSNNDTLNVLGSAQAYVGQALMGDGTNTITMTGGSIGSARAYGGNDTVTLTGADIGSLDLGSGTNRLTVNAGAQVGEFRADGNETVTLNGDGRILVIKMDGGTNVLKSDTGFIESFVSYEARNTLTIGSGGIGEILIMGSPAAQTITASGWVGSLQVYAGSFATVAATTVKLGADGAGYIQTSKGNDIITTGAGSVDGISTFDGADRVTVGAGGVAAISTGIGNDTVNAAGGYVDVVSTGDGNDSVTTGASGAGYVSLGAGNDTVVLSAFTPADTMIVVGGDGTDTANMTGFGAALRVSLAQPGLIQNVGAATGVTTPALGFVGLSGIENLIGSNSGDWIEGGADANVLTGLGGNDTISGLDGNDSLLGGRGNDSLTGGAGVDRFVFVTGDGTDRVADFTVGEDRVELREANALADLTFTQVGADVRVVFGTWTGIFEDMLVADLRVASNFLF